MVINHLLTGVILQVGTFPFPTSDTFRFIEMTFGGPQFWGSYSLEV